MHEPESSTNQSQAPRISQRAEGVAPFLVMEILEQAQALERSGRDVIHLEVGEPDFDTPPCVVEAAKRALAAGHTHYTHSMGLLELREAICEQHAAEYGVATHPDQVVVCSGTSPAMQLVFAALCEPGDEVILTDPHYACYPNILRVLGIVPRCVPISAQEGFRVPVEAIREALGPRTRAVVVNSPANPTGAVLAEENLRELAQLPVPIVSDEIYHGVTYGVRAHSMREFSDEVFVLNGFSKRYAMTGWRLGYVIAPRRYASALQRMQQNLFICAADFAQHAALAAIRCAAHDAERMRQVYERRREVMLAGVREAGLDVPYEPRGAFYVLADARNFCSSSLELARRILHETGVGVAPGIDFGQRAEGHIRLSYATSEEDIAEALRRLKRFFAALSAC